MASINFNSKYLVQSRIKMPNNSVSSNSVGYVCVQLNISKRISFVDSLSQDKK